MLNSCHEKEQFAITPSLAQMDQQTQNDLLCDLIRKQIVEIDQLKTEVRRVKNLKSRPKIRPSKMNREKDGSNKNNGVNGNEKRPGSKKRSKRDAMVNHQKEIIRAEDIPEGQKLKYIKNI